MSMQGFKSVVFTTIASVIVMFLLLPEVIRAETATFSPAADATIIDPDSSNVGSLPVLEISNSDSESRLFLIRFDLTTLPENVQITDATLVINHVDSSGNDIGVNVYALDSSWSESTVTYSTIPVIDRSIDYGFQNIGANSSITVGNLGELIQNWVANSDTNFGLAFESSSEGEYSYSFSSKEGSAKPTLSVSYDLVDDKSPKVSNSKVKELSGTSVLVSWTTDEPATGFVEFGQSQNYGNIAGKDTLSTGHSVELTSLEKGTLYHYRIFGEDELGNEYSVTGGTFQIEPSDEAEELEMDPVDDEPEVANDDLMTESFQLEVKQKGEEKKEILLSWNYNLAEQVDAFRIYRSKGDSASYTFITEVAANDSEYIDSSVGYGETYFYQVRAISDGAEVYNSTSEVITIESTEEDKFDGEKLSFWKGLLYLNVVILPGFGVWYFFFRKRDRNNKTKRGKKSPTKN